MPPAKPTIILSYRRDDSAGVTGRIFDRLVQEFGTDRVFMDIDSMPAGVDFHEHLQAILADCGALLVVIGKSWRSQRKGQPARIMDPDDWVRIEVETALERRIPVVPLLIDGALLPSRDQLPETLWPLLRRNALPIDSGRDFHAQMSRLIRDLQGQLGPVADEPGVVLVSSKSHTMTPARPPNWPAIGRWLLILAAIITIGAIAITGADRGDGVEQESRADKLMPEPPPTPSNAQ